MTDRYADLRAALDARAKGGSAGYERYLDKATPETIRALLADYDRMRDALETIAVYPHARDQEMSAAAMRKIARAALAQEGS